MGIAEGRIKRQKHEPPYNHVIGSDVNRFLKLWNVPNKIRMAKICDESNAARMDALDQLRPEITAISLKRKLDDLQLEKGKLESKLEWYRNQGGGLFV